MSKSTKVAMLISGGGTTLKNLLDHNERGELDLDFRLVISSKANVKGLDIANEASIPYQVSPKKNYSSPQAYSDHLFQACRTADVDYVLMGGFLTHVLIPKDFKNRVINTHPSLIPSFCGHGYYGLRVHQAVLDYGAKISGCTIHFVDNQYDHGPIILQKSVPVLTGDTAEQLGRRVFEMECLAYPEVLRLLAANRISVSGRRVSIKEDSVAK